MALLKLNNNFISLNGKLLKDNYDPKFIIVVDTTKAGSASNTFILPTAGTGYNAVVEWGDGTSQTITGTPGNVTKVYSTSGTYEIKISGLFPRIFFNNSGDKLKLKEIKNWGGIVWGSMDNAFVGCSNMTGTYKDSPNTSNVISMRMMFWGCSSFNQVINFNTSLVTDMVYMFRGCGSLNSPITLYGGTGVGCSCHRMFQECYNFNSKVTIDTSKIAGMDYMFGVCYNFNQDISNFNVESVTNMTSMLNSSFAFSTTNYNLLLISWAAQNVQSNVSFDAGDAQCSGDDAKAARLHLINTHGWTITDTPPV